MGGEGAVGDENYFYKGSSEHIVYNRELFFAQFLREQKRDDVFWLTEPDHRIVRRFPELAEDIDLCLLRRDDEVAITPCWKLARRTAAPFFEEACTYFDDSKGKQWHGATALLTSNYGRTWVAQASRIHLFHTKACESSYGPTAIIQRKTAFTFSTGRVTPKANYSNRENER